MEIGNLNTPSKNPAAQHRSLNSTVERANANELLPVEGGLLSVTPSMYGITVDYSRVNRAYHGYQTFDVILMPKGPQNEADFTDSRYWALKTIIGQTAGADMTSPTQLYADFTVNMFYGVVHNLNEVSTGTHSLIPFAGDTSIALVNAAVYSVTMIQGIKITTDTNDLANNLFVFRSGDNTGFRDAKILAITAINGVIEWRYTIQLGNWVNPTLTSPGTWTPDTSAATIYAFNSAEDKNTYTGTATSGGGITVASSTGIINSGTCRLQPLPVGGFVTVKFRNVGSDTNTYYTIINATNSGQ